MTALKKLTIKSLRGSVQEFSLPFEKGKRVTIIYGENGAGKSTICDAFELIAKGVVGSLAGRGLRQTTSYWPSLGKNLADIAVTLASVGGTCETRVGSNGVVVASPAAHRPVVEIFRRRQILGPIEAQPGERYQAIERFVDVSEIETSESALRDLIKDLKTRQNDAVLRLRENRDEIERHWDTAGRPGGEALQWAETEAARDSSAIEDEASAIDGLHRIFKQLEQRPGLLAAAAGAYSGAAAQASAAAEVVQERITAVAQDAGEVVAILQAAQPYLARVPSPEACPLCESTEQAEGLGDRVASRLGTFRALLDAQKAASAATAAEARALERLNAERDSAAREARAFESSRAAQVWPPELPLPQVAAPEDPSHLSEWLAVAASLAAQWEAERDRRRVSRRSQASLQRALSNLHDNTKTAEDIAAAVPRLEAMLKVVEAERRKFTDEVLSEISDEVGRLYERVHPGEGLEKIALQLDPKRRASLEIGAEFQGTHTKPQAYFSDSHLDTLGLCILLALALREKPGEKILVLDDVLASADEPHVERLVDVLYTEAAKFRHCIITTHYRPWKEKLRWGLLKTRECHFVELSRWSITGGITLTGSVPEIERLRDLLASSEPDLQSVCAKAGVILEAALDFLTLRYECRAPRRAGRLTLGDLLDAINKKLRQALRAEVKAEVGQDGAAVYETVHLGPLLDELGQLVHARNLFGCHFNELSFHLLDSDALAFGRCVLTLAEALVDLEDGWPKSDKSGSYWATTSEARRLHPLQQPK